MPLKMPAITQYLEQALTFYSHFLLHMDLRWSEGACEMYSLEQRVYLLEKILQKVLSKISCKNGQI